MERFDFSDIDKNAHIHFIGIGGISMSGIAQILLARGYKVTGSDRCESAITDKLEKMGAVIYYEHKAENVVGADLVVHTAAVHGDNPEIEYAIANNIRLIDRAECLGAVMKRYKHCVCVAGTHGKTTTTSMLAHATLSGNLNPTISVGGELDIIDGNIKLGDDDLFVTEACEYTNSFLKFYPTIAVITNIEADHLDFFRDIDDIIVSFRKFACLTGKSGMVVALGSDKNIKRALENTDLNVVYYGIGDYEYNAKNIIYNNGYPEFDVMYKNELLCHISLNVTGEHNILNALAAIAVCRGANVDINDAVKGIEGFTGTHRRFEKKGEYNGAVVIDDYAHHPTEIKATLSALSKMNHNKVWCIFQPHTYTRTKALFSDFVGAFSGVDELIITDIYAAREKPDGVTTGKSLAEAIKSPNAKYIGDFKDITQYIRENVSPGDVVITMGAGTVTEIGPMILA